MTQIYRADMPSPRGFSCCVTLVIGSRRLAGRCTRWPPTRTRWSSSCYSAAMPAWRTSQRGWCAGSCSSGTDIWRTPSRWRSRPAWRVSPRLPSLPCNAELFGVTKQSVCFNDHYKHACQHMPAGRCTRLSDPCGSGTDKRCQSRRVLPQRLTVLVLSLSNPLLPGYLRHPPAPRHGHAAHPSPGLPSH